MSSRGQKRVWLVAGGREVDLAAGSLIVGILNVTPDSFSDGGRYAARETALERAIAMLEEGAALIDVGGESTRPGYEPVSTTEEIERVVPVVKALLDERSSAIVSVDTSKSEVARAALGAGALVVNDVWGFLKDEALATVVAESGAGAILMRNGREESHKGSILDRVRSSWERSVAIALKAGVATASIVLDPGIGFGTTRQEDLELLRGLDVLRSFGFPMMLGASRKRITGEPLGLAATERMETTLATSVAAIAAGVELLRVHDVLENARAASLADLIYRGGELK